MDALIKFLLVVLYEAITFPFKYVFRLFRRIYELIVPVLQPAKGKIAQFLRFFVEKIAKTGLSFWHALPAVFSKINNLVIPKVCRYTKAVAVTAFNITKATVSVLATAVMLSYRLITKICGCSKHALIKFLTAGTQYVVRAVLAVKNAILSLLSASKNIILSPLTATRRAVNFSNTLVKNIFGKGTSTYSPLRRRSHRKLSDAAVAGAKRTIIFSKNVAKKIVLAPFKAATFVSKALASFAKNIVECVLMVLRRTLSVAMHPIAVCGLLFALIVSGGLRFYDEKILRAQNEILISKHRTEGMEQQKHRFLANVYSGTDREKRLAEKEKNTAIVDTEKGAILIGDSAVDNPIKSNAGTVHTEVAANTADIRAAVDEYFRGNSVSGISAVCGNCKIRVGGKVLNKNSRLEDGSDIYISDIDDDYITFADSTGNTYSKSIVSMMP